jgi:uncharacterized YigZ family protein
MDESYRTTFSYGEDEIIINKSRFIGYSMPINDEEEALEFIESIKEKHRDATHNVYAYVVGLNSNIQRFSDDGEPSGTAGIPVLEVIKKEDLRNIVIVVTRYYGGTKLGGGGLIRAYTKSAKIGLDAGIVIDMTPHRKLLLTLDYTEYGKIENYLMTNEYIMDGADFQADVTIEISVQTSTLEEFKTTMTNLTNGDITITELDSVFLPLKNGKRLV